MAAGHAGSDAQWSVEKANRWYGKQPWIVGCNFIPSTAINQLEMWQGDTFDLPTIDRELGYAQSIGMNSVRVFLHSLAWEQDQKGFKSRMTDFLKVADKHKIKTMFVLFDSCWDPEPHIGKQRAPRIGVHNGGWVQCPGAKSELDASSWPKLKDYTYNVVHSFRRDPRILMWDVYNEPRKEALPLLKEVFQWVRSASPNQPVTSAPFGGDETVSAFQLSASDITTCHNYEPADKLSAFLDKMAVGGRPVICSEWMARTAGSTVKTNLHVFKDHHAGCMNWGLVTGKTETMYPWGSKEGTPEPAVWFHDLFRADGTPFDPAEAALFKQLTQRGG